MDTFLEGVAFRHACKIFDEEKKIPTEVFENILQVGLNAPSSFGMEPTRIMVIKHPNNSKPMRNAIQTTSKTRVMMNIRLAIGRHYKAISPRLR